MKGFFSKDQVQLIGGETKGMSCATCGLYKTALTPKMEPYGDFRKKIMVIGEGPKEREDVTGKMWQGKGGRVLRQAYKKLGIDLFQDCVSIGAINCFSEKPPNDYQISCCRRKVIAAIKKYQPKVIILHGLSAVSSVITGYTYKGGRNGIAVWRGWAIPDRMINAYICPTFHPSFIEKQEQENEVEVIWKKDLKQAFEKVDQPFPDFQNEEDNVTISYDPEKVLDKLLKERPSLLAFDIETTGLKPYNKKYHEIITISFCAEMNKSYAIPMPTEKKSLKKLKRLLEHPNIRKIAANMKFEDNWLTTLHGINVNFDFDTMQAAHILDNRPNITGLKFQSYVRFGVPNYDEDVSSFLKSPHSNIPNKIKELIQDKDSFRKLLLYNGIDSLMTYRLAKLQKEEIGI